MKKCYYSKKCGGCSYINLEYSSQLEIKQEEIQDLFPRNKVNKINVYSRR